HDTMPHIATRAQWLGTIALAVLVAALVFWRTWVQPSTDPISEGWAAFQRGEWETAAGLARAGLKVKANNVDALRLLARASVRLGRDDTATALFRRFGAKAMVADDLCLLG